MYKYPKKFIVWVVVVLCAALVPFVYAASSETTYPNFAGITTAVAKKLVVSTSTQVYCTSYSFTQSPSTNITHIGYNTFSCTVSRSDGAYQQLKDLDGDLDYNDYHHSKVFTSGIGARAGYSRNSVSAGSHDFGHFNGNTYNWDPSLSASQIFYP